MKILFAIIMILATIAAIIGEFMCVVKFVRQDFEAPYKAEIVYGLGAFTGLGTIIGYLDIE